MGHASSSNVILGLFISGGFARPLTTINQNSRFLLRIKKNPTNNTGIVKVAMKKNCSWGLFYKCRLCLWVRI
jgi:hypothetical protein